MVVSLLKISFNASCTLLQTNDQNILSTTLRWVPYLFFSLSFLSWNTEARTMLAIWSACRKVFGKFCNTYMYYMCICSTHYTRLLSCLKDQLWVPKVIHQLCSEAFRSDFPMLWILFALWKFLNWSNHSWKSLMNLQ